MKKITKLFLILLYIISTIILVGCDALKDIIGGDTDNSHISSYEPITGIFYLYEAFDERINCENTYFDINGSKDDFSLKYYENGVLKKEGKFKKVIVYEDKVGYWCDNLHLNIKCGDTYEHISAYTESFDPVNQFRIIDEYSGGNKEMKYYYSELPFVLGTYVREGVDFVAESSNKNDVDYSVPTKNCYTSELNGKYVLDENHYFYFISPKGYTLKNGDYLDSYFQYYAPGLNKPLEGFAHGIYYDNSYNPPCIFFTYSRESSFYDALADNENSLMFGYTTFDEDDTMIEHFGSIDFSDGVLKSFTFKHLSRRWTEEEWDIYTKNEDAKLPDAILYDYVGGTYIKK